ncbi:hypothetical protein [Neisseria zoodegmatis]|uniref:Uncharacterized protein n=1 Tax=Neisseria zoodegmatis TaxID=326523 RepID=A0ABX3WII5_9NEIS|nr:hypothetical protein [Neisseria zoodegmatis]OSI11273.1 hypothetical protein BWD10_02475 [Neisseria zoodegmatis]
MKRLLFKKRIEAGYLQSIKYQHVRYHTDLCKVVREKFKAAVCFSNKPASMMRIEVFFDRLAVVCRLHCAGRLKIKYPLSE